MEPVREMVNTRFGDDAHDRYRFAIYLIAGYACFYWAAGLNHQKKAFPESRQQAQAQFLQKGIVLAFCHRHSFFKFHQRGMSCCQVNVCLAHCRADVARDVQVEIILLNLGHLHPA